MTNVIRISGTIDALSPIVHGGDEKTGSTPVLRSITHWDATAGRHVQLPFFSGNAIRGRMRRMLFHDLIARIGYEVKSPKLHHALFTGGILESTADKYAFLDLPFRRDLRDSVPPIGLLGTAIGNQILDGCLKVNHAFPVCAEYASCLPESLLTDPRAQQSVRTFTDISFATRRDDLRAERDDDEQATQMLIEFESFIPGTRFTHGFILDYASPVEAACLAHGINLWRDDPVIGGKGSSGYGQVAFSYQCCCGVDACGHLSPDAYLDYLSQQQQQVIDRLAHLEARWK